MLYKPDFAQAQERMLAFWAHDCVGRCALQIVARKEGIAPAVEDDADLATKKTNITHVLEQVEQSFERYYYLAEAIPRYVPGLVCSDTAAFLMEDITLMEDTVWYRPAIEDWQTYDLQFDPNNRWWQLTRAMAEAAVEQGKGKYLVAVPDFQVAIDIVSLLRSPDRLCLDLMENPDCVKRATTYILDHVYAYCYREIRAIIARHSEWIADWIGLFARGEHDVVQCDFCALISPRHFEQFCLPDIRKQCQQLDTSIFHLDGPDAVRHLDALLEIPELDAIQWVPGAGKPPAVGWLPMLKRVQRAGKSLVISSPAADVERILEELSPCGLMISVDDVFETRAEAERFIGQVEAIRAPRR